MTELDNEKDIRDIHAELVSLTKHVEAAFLRDDSGEIDFAAHRKFHKEQINAKDKYEDSKRKIINTILSWVAIGVLTILGNALVQYLIFVKP